MTMPQMAKKLDVAVRAVERSIKKLKRDGKLKRVGSNKTGYWQILK
ncbi:MAG: hypothetical protein ACI4QI_06055 [Candidatus Coproplasma sp.]